VPASDQLTVTEAFNAGTDTGDTLPFTVGRPIRGNINSPILTDANGVATTFMNYPVTALNRPVILTAQGNGNKVGAVFRAIFPGIAPAALTANPTQASVLANTPNFPVNMRLIDAQQSPLPGVSVISSVSTLVTGNILDPATVGVADNPSCCTDLNGQCTAALQVEVCQPDVAGAADNTRVQCTSTSTVNWSGAGATATTTVATSNSALCTCTTNPGGTCISCTDTGCQCNPPAAQ
jgi:hypothetical protein